MRVNGTKRKFLDSWLEHPRGGQAWKYMLYGEGLRHPREMTGNSMTRGMGDGSAARGGPY